MEDSTTTKKPCWSIAKNPQYLLIKLTGILNADEILQFELASEELFKSADFSNLVVDCDGVADIPLNWIKSLLQLQKNVKTLNKQMRLIHLAQPMINHFRDQGLAQSLPNDKTLRDALVSFGIVTKKAIDVDFINPFLSSCMKVLEIQASTSSQPGAIKMKEDKTRYLGDISGVIGLVSDSFNGSVVISFPEATFLKIMSRMLGEEFTAMNKDIQDGAAELTNMIFGQAKVILNEKGYGLQTAIPTVVTGQNHTVQSLSNGPQVVVPFKTDVGDFFIEICTSG